MESIVQAAITLLANLLFGIGAFDRIVGAVERWADKEISGVEKREGVLDELQVIGLQLSKSFANLAVELAVAYVKQGKK